jgi:hypothetical protein
MLPCRPGVLGDGPGGGRGGSHDASAGDADRIFVTYRPCWGSQSPAPHRLAGDRRLLRPPAFAVDVGDPADLFLTPDK